MPQIPMIKSLPAAFRMNAMQADGVERGEDYWWSARDVVAESSRGRMDQLIDEHLDTHIMEVDQANEVETAEVGGRDQPLIVPHPSRVGREADRSILQLEQ
jgi:hypothetical protein